VGITGSAGKTTTKELTRAALAGARRVHATRGNLNNRVGMPLTLLAAPDEVEVVVLELGTNEPGEIATLAAVARPDIGVVTTVGEAHLEKLGSVQGVLREKLDLLRGLAAGGRCVVGDEPEELVREARRVCPGVRVAGWGERADEDLRPEDVEVDHWGAHRFVWRGRTAALSLNGRHAVTDALLALAVSELLGVSPADAVAGLATVAPGAMRGEVRRVGDLTVVVDCYNANPPSVRAAMELLERHTASRRVAVLGTMLELGDASARLHRDVLADALDRSVDLLVATGAFAEAAAELGVEAPERILAAPSWQEAYPALKERLGGREVVLLKASRGVALEGILPLLEADFGTAPPDDAGGEG
jgi:UDP-N-acetylmuramoyl-tripeptide--D-alanyl-D-alanine ligase